MNTASDTWMSFLQYGGYVHSQGVCSMSPQRRQGMCYSYMLTYIMGRMRWHRPLGLLPKQPLVTIPHLGEARH